MEAVTCNFLKEFWEDLSDKRFIPYKVLYFLLLFGVVIFYLQLTVHLQTLGIPVSQIAYIQSLTFVLQIIFPFLTSVCAEKLGNFKVLLVGVTLFQAVIIFLFSLVPSVEIFCDGKIIRGHESSNITEACKHELHTSTNFTLWFYVIIRILFTILNNATMTIYDAAILLLTKESKIDFGKQRAWGTLGALSSAYTGGMLVDYYSIGKENKDYSIIFYVSCAVTALSGVLMLVFIDIRFKFPTQQLSKKVFKTFKSADAIIFLLVVIFAGLFSGFIDTFMYIFISNLGASSTLIGLTVVAAAPFEFILNIFATNIIKKIGYVNTFGIAFISYFIRLIGIGYLTSSSVYCILILEMLDAFCFGLFYTAVIMHSSELVGGEEVITTVRGIVGASYAGLGKMCGALIGNEIFKRLPAEFGWKIASIVPLSFAIFQMSYGHLRPRCQKKTIETINKKINSHSDYINKGFEETSMDHMSHN